MAQYVYALLEHGTKLLQFVIDDDPDGLERTRGWMNPVTVRRRGIGDDFRQLSGAPDRRLVARRNNRPRDSRRVSFLTVSFQNSLQFLFIHTCEPVRRADAGIRIHSHVEGTVTEEAEATACFVQLR